jgi:quercetin dioxygenase-like cupin family protein
MCVLSFGGDSAIPKFAGVAEQMLLAFDSGIKEPVHEHASQRQWIVLSGELEFDCAGKKTAAKSGDVVLFPVLTPYSSVCIKSATVLQTFFGEGDFIWRRA